MGEEIWKELEENSNYFISNFGNFKNKKDKLLKLNINARGYLYCNISTNGKVTKVKIHRLVAIYFIDNLENKDTVNHKDGNKRNNHKSNLEWITKVDNVKHAWKSGLCDSKHKKCEISKDGLEWIKFDKLVDAKVYLESTGAKLANVSHLVRAAKQNEGLETPKYLCRGFYVKYVN